VAQRVPQRRFRRQWFEEWQLTQFLLSLTASIVTALPEILPLAIKTLKLLVVLARSGVKRENRGWRWWLLLAD
jgi:hypothetical protein